MVRKLYHESPYTRIFSGKVVKQFERPDGKWEVVLDQTAFYPTSGGQPCDLGTLGGKAVLDVAESEGEIIHILAGPLPLGEPVEGRIDWERRVDHMQQHCGQHILSQAFLRIMQAETVSFHLSENSVTIDLDCDDLTWDQAREVERLANDVVMGSLPVTIHEFDDLSDLNLPVRKISKVAKNIRVVEIDKFDYSPCGGTHPASTGEIGLIKILKWERQKGNVRVHFACGRRALADYQEKTEIINKLTSRLSVGMEDFVETIDAWDQELKKARKDLFLLTTQLLEYEARNLAAAMEHNVVVAKFQGRPVQELRVLLNQVLKICPEGVVLLGVEHPKPFVLFGAGENSTVDVSQILRECGTKYGWRGGGTPKVAQGGADAVNLDEGLAWARELACAAGVNRT